MSDTSGAYPPPPPPSVPPPTYGAPPSAPPNVQLPPGYNLPPGYQGPTAPDYSQPYQYQQQAYPPPVSTSALVFGGTGAILHQFGGAALYSIIAGVAAIALPFIAGRYFIVLPIFGALAGFRAMSRGRFIGGLFGLFFNIIGGLVSLWASGLVG